MPSKRNKLKVFPCNHVDTKAEKSYVRVSDDPMDGYYPIIITTCRHCNKELTLSDFMESE